MLQLRTNLETTGLLFPYIRYRARVSLNFTRIQNNIGMSLVTKPGEQVSMGEKKMGLYEKSLSKESNYLTWVYDFKGVTVDHIENGRGKKNLYGISSLLMPWKSAKIEAIASIFLEYLKNIKPVFKTRIINAVSGVLNSTIQTVKKMVCFYNVFGRRVK